MADPLMIAIQEESRARMKKGGRSSEGGGAPPGRCEICDRKGGRRPGCQASPMEIDAISETVARGRNAGAGPMVTDQRVACELLMAYRDNFPPH